MTDEKLFKSIKIDFYISVGVSSWIDEDKRQEYKNSFANILKFAECAMRYAEMGRGDLMAQSKEEILFELSRCNLLVRNPIDLDIIEKKQ